MISFLDPANGSMLERLREAIQSLYAAKLKPAYLNSEEGARDIDAHTTGRYETCAQMIVPWVERCRKLNGLTVVEIGSGTGSSTVAFAQRSGQIAAYEISQNSTAIARARCEIMGLANVEFICLQPANLLPTIRDRHHGGCDVILLFAVLEHLTIPERLETLRTSWELLRPGGLLVIGECPNRLTCFDHHTSLLPFFNWLPDQLAFPYADRSPRAAFPIMIRANTNQSPQAAEEARLRAGIGASYHEFELALGRDYASFLAADGFEPEVVGWSNSPMDERLLQTYFLENRLDVPLGFTRSLLNLIFHKPPLSGPPAGRWTGASPGDRLPLVTNYQAMALRLAEMERHSGLPA